MCAWLTEGLGEAHEVGDLSGGEVAQPQPGQLLQLLLLRQLLQTSECFLHLHDANTETFGNDDVRGVLFVSSVCGSRRPTSVSEQDCRTEPVPST